VGGSFRGGRPQSDSETWDSDSKRYKLSLTMRCFNREGESLGGEKSSGFYSERDNK